MEEQINESQINEAQINDDRELKVRLALSDLTRNKYFEANQQNLLLEANLLVANSELENAVNGLSSIEELKAKNNELEVELEKVISQSDNYVAKDALIKSTQEYEKLKVKFEASESERRELINKIDNGYKTTIRDLQGQIEILEKKLNTPNKKNGDSKQELKKE